VTGMFLQVYHQRPKERCRLLQLKCKSNLGSAGDVSVLVEAFAVIEPATGLRNQNRERDITPKIGRHG